MKNLIVLLIFVLVSAMAYSQRYDTQYEENPAFNIFLQGNEQISEIRASSLLSFIGYEGAPRYNQLQADFGINSQDNIAFSFEVSQLKLADFLTTNIDLGYVYRLPNTRWSAGLALGSSWSKFDVSKLNTYDQINQDFYKQIPGLSANMGVFYGGEKFKFSLAGKQMILGNSDLSELDKSLLTDIVIDFGYYFPSSSQIGFGFNIGSDVSDFNLLKSKETLPIHLDLIVDIMKSFQVIIKSDYTRGMILGISQQTEKFIWFVNQNFPFMVFGDGPNGSMMSTEIGFGIRFSGNKKAGEPLPHFTKNNKTEVEKGGDYGDTT